VPVDLVLLSATLQDCNAIINAIHEAHTLIR
jgi:hypothetical protein